MAAAWFYPSVSFLSSFPPSCSPQVDSIDNFTPSNTPSREDDPKSLLKSHSRSPSMASDMEPIEVRKLSAKLLMFFSLSNLAGSWTGMFGMLLWKSRKLLNIQMASAAHSHPA